jgi:hypothetical protein
MPVLTVVVFIAVEAGPKAGDGSAYTVPDIGNSPSGATQ